MEQKSLQVFDFQSRKVRVVDFNGTPAFVTKDVVEAVGNIWSGVSRVEHVPKEWRGVTSVATPSGIQEMQVLLEQGVYFYLIRCDKPAALTLQKKIAGEIIPSLRKYGVYMTAQKIEEILLNPDAIIKIATQLKEERTRREELETKVKADTPKVLFADSVAASKTSILIGDFAKILRQNNVAVGQNRFFQWLRDNAYLISRKGDSYNMPTQYSMENEWFEIKERSIDSPDGSIRITKTPKMTGKGQIYFMNLFLNKAA